MNHGPAQPKLRGLVAEFENEEAVVEATQKTVDAGYHHIETYTPYPLDELLDIQHLHKNKVALVILIGGLTGCAVGFFMQWFASVIHYPINVGGRPLNSWPAFIPVMFECTVLFASFAALIGMMVMNKLPRPNHPLFDIERFRYATQDRFFLCIEAEDPYFEKDATRQFLEELNPHEVNEVEA
ncbi:MAG: DUF3341 domain-containing protein [Gemmatimonadetes bacterium]|nr:DUF3341 domain-containing protein [Gemmatimonadota bacterium]MYG85227.1 DUF3341 domain-containing protein [Gemmatimonadota bacterium]MYJ91227.1 DUF3341 domain-containing protein [Gemmatimonadota bacterium]